MWAEGDEGEHQNGRGDDDHGSYLEDDLVGVLRYDVLLARELREVREGPDGFLYLLTDEAEDGALLKIEPAY